MPFFWIIILAAVTFVTGTIATGNNAISLICVIIFFPSAITLYFSPAIAAAMNKHRNVTAVFILDLLLGWTLIGWVGALVWAYSTSDASVTGPIRSPIPDVKKCPFCAEDIRPEAIKCRHCGSELGADARAPAIIAATPVQANDQELMTELGVRRDGDQYVFQQYRYDRLSDAIAYAKSHQDTAR